MDVHPRWCLSVCLSVVAHLPYVVERAAGGHSNHGRERVDDEECQARLLVARSAPAMPVVMMMVLLVLVVVVLPLPPPIELLAVLIVHRPVVLNTTPRHRAVMACRDR